MPSSHQAPGQSPRCPVCRAEVSAVVGFCEACGANLSEALAEEIRSLNYLLGELARWAENGLVGHEQAGGLREKYEQRRDSLRAQLKASQRPRRPKSAPQDESLHVPERQAQTPSQAVNSPPRAGERAGARRALLETLADPHTIRLLLYTGAAMLVVGVVIGLRDILYLKLREPIVQASVLVIGTGLVTVCGWLTILRTRLLLTGRALTLIGSLLVPVNFWFLVRSGLIENNGRAWLVCVLCALLYALTAAFLRERLYVYLSSVAAIASTWALIYRVEREAYGLYALALMGASLFFLHLSRLFPARTSDGRLPARDGQISPGSQQLATGHRLSSLMTPWSYELWGMPLVQVALCGAALGLLFYMPLRTGSASAFADGLFRLRSSGYDAGLALLLSFAVAYAAWFAGRYVLMGSRAFLYTASALALLWAEFIWADGLRIPGASQLLLLAVTALLLALTARVLKSEVWAWALRRASLIGVVALAFLTYPVISVSPASAVLHSLILVLLTVTYAISGSPPPPQSSLKGAGETFAHAAIALAVEALFVLQIIIHWRAGEPLLLAPSVALGATGLLLIGVSMRVKTLERVRYFRAGLFALITAFTLAALRAGFEPFGDMEVYTSPVGVMLVVVAYLHTRLERDEYTSDARLLLWAGSLLLAAPLLLHALSSRLFVGVPAAWRDLATLCAALALLFLGITGRLRAPLLVGAAALAIELSALALTSVNWLQVPLKVYLVTTGALILLCWGLLEFRREQILLVRKRFNERREVARERFGEWK